ncbi:carbonyl reductase [NADPH] 1-like [Hydractinia symbiolongicarpus]|uniref:carbonyl reductase [NADPH] 1-like n=1 Tax=Hydractinia symbiolongicarpus TaxID=13093 RepID=UPI00254CF8F0|nr:carbonyl reductase [NADPH] 1-like [Hydractinia symbiolongicarpus]
MSRVFVVTGSNQGIGKSIVKLLLQDNEKKIVYLTSRNKENGEAAVKDLQDLGLQPAFHQLDITDRKSIETLRDYLVEKHGGLDVLVNNAGMAYKSSSNAPFSEQAEVTVDCNFFGTLAVCDILFPILKQNARVAHVSSFTSEFAFNKLDSNRKEQFTDKNLKIEDLEKLLKEFVNDAKEDKVTERGWAKSGYAMSKLGVALMSKIQQRDLDTKFPEKNVLVNSCCPGIVNTNMTGGKYPNAITPDEGADTPTYLALLPRDVNEPKGCYVKSRKVSPFPPKQ